MCDYRRAGGVAIRKVVTVIFPGRPIVRLVQVVWKQGKALGGEEADVMQVDCWQFTAEGISREYGLSVAFGGQYYDRAAFWQKFL
jgi:hypothetical protein